MELPISTHQAKNYLVKWQLGRQIHQEKVAAAMRKWIVSFAILASYSFGEKSQGQSTGIFTRNNATDQIGAFVSSGAIAGNDSDFADFDEDADLLVSGGNSASASDSGSTADVVGLAEANDLTPLGGSTAIPTVDTAVSQSQIVTAIAPARATTMEGTGASSAAESSYELNGTAASGFLRGSIHLVGLVNKLTGGNGQIVGSDTTVSASVNGFGADAVYSASTEMWTVDVTLPGSTFTINAEGVNEFFTFAIPITLPFTLQLEAESSSGIQLVAGSSANGDAQAQINLHAGAWAQFTPTEDSPPEGDFDGDGLVDGTDFLIWQRGVDETFSGTQSEGDANHDGAVDGFDLDAWKANFGSTPSVQRIPEPGSLAILLIGVIASCARQIRGGRPQC